MKTSTMESSLASQKPMDESHTKMADSAWKPLYRIGAVAALIMVVFIVIEIPIYLAWPPPSTVIGYFTLFQNNRLLGLLNLDLLLMLSNALLVLMYLALYAALRRASPSFMAIALTLGLVGIAAYFASNTASRCFPSATSTRLRRRMHRDRRSRPQGRRCLRSTRVLLSMCIMSWAPLPR
jgi:hypothetical protein